MLYFMPKATGDYFIDLRIVILQAEPGFENELFSKFFSEHHKQGNEVYFATVEGRAEAECIGVIEGRYEIR